MVPQWLKDWIKSIRAALDAIYTSVCDGIIAIITAIGDFFRWAVTQIGDFFQAALDFIGRIVSDITQWFFDLIFGDNGFLAWCGDFVGDWVEWILESFPDLGLLLQEYRGSIDYAMGLVSGIDCLFPVTETLYLLVTFVAFVVCFIVVKLVLKLIPWSIG